MPVALDQVPGDHPPVAVDQQPVAGRCGIGDGAADVPDERDELRHVWRGRKARDRGGTGQCGRESLDEWMLTRVRGTRTPPP